MILSWDNLDNAIISFSGRILFRIQQAMRGEPIPEGLQPYDRQALEHELIALSNYLMFAWEKLTDARMGDYNP